MKINSISVLLNKIHHTCIHLNYAYSIWNMPNKDEIYWLIAPHYSNFDILKLNESGTGYVVSRFDKQKKYFLKPLFWGKNTDLLFGNKSDFESFLLLHSNSFLTIESFVETSYTEYIQTVEKAIEKIRQDICRKIVISRAKEVTFNSTFLPNDYFLTLCIKHKTAFKSWAYVPEEGAWMGASPEVLIKVENGFFKTMSLAGTQVVKDGLESKDAVWSQKEIEEQALVSKYIISCFKALRIREFDDIGPRTTVAGSIMHLKTDFLVDLSVINQANFPYLMLDLLHPTSAICGMPLKEASEFIKNNELLNRDLFAGYWGPVNFTEIDLEGTHLYVNIRCMRFTQNNAVLYAGAGITLESDPEKEWLETENKLKTIGDGLKKYIN